MISRSTKSKAAVYGCKPLSTTISPTSFSLAHCNSTSLFLRFLSAKLCSYSLAQLAVHSGSSQRSPQRLDVPYERTPPLFYSFTLVLRTVWYIVLYKYLLNELRMLKGYGQFKFTKITNLFFLNIDFGPHLRKGIIFYWLPKHTCKPVSLLALWNVVSLSRINQFN